MPRKYKRSKSVKRSLRRSRSRTRGGGSCNSTPKFSYNSPCNGLPLDSEFSKAMSGGSGKSTLRMRRSNKSRKTSRRTYRRRNTKRGRKSRKQRGAGFFFNPAASSDYNTGGSYSTSPYNDCCPPVFGSGVNPDSYGTGGECNADGSVAQQEASLPQGSLEQQVASM